jgi:uncharacterized RDD family membrane protein YckC
MSWYYAENGQQIGPVDENRWASLVSEGTIKPTTLVWRDGMPNWAPFAQMSQGGGAVVTEAGGSLCSECGRSFSEDELIEIEGRPVCAGCKPIVVQKLKEGVLTPSLMNYGGFWIRAGAKIIDYIVIYVVNLVPTFIYGFLAGAAGREPGQVTPATFVLIAIQLAVSLTYNTWFLGKYGATPGKMACGLRVVRPDGSGITYGRAAGRFFAEMLSSAILYIGYIMVAFDDEKRGLHDRICDTRVIRK